jgi:molybdopterin converting factor subunit 1
MIVRVQLFAAARQLAGHEAVDVEVPQGATVGQLRAALAAQVPPLAGLARQMLFAVDAEYAADSRPIPPAADVAAIPPVSGG